MPETSTVVTDILAEIARQVLELAKKTAKKMRDEAIADAEAFLIESREDLARYIDLLVTEQVKREEFNLLVNSLKSTGKMLALKNAGASASKIQKILIGIIGIILTANITKQS